MGIKIKKILITGADGFIGSHLAEKMVEVGYTVEALVFYNSFNSCGWLDYINPRIKSAMKIHTGDVRDTNFVNSIVAENDAVLHLAALIGIPYSYHNPASYVGTNVVGTLNVLEAATKHNLEKVVHVSTSEVYGTAQFIPITEQHPLNAQSPYAASKIAADQMALSFYRSFNTPVAIARPFNTYGPRQSLRAVIPTIVTQISRGNRFIELGNVKPTRDFSFVEDLVTGMIAILESEKSVGEVINLGSGFEISIKNTAEAIAKIMNANIEIKIAQDRLRAKTSEVEQLYAGVDKAKRLLPWNPKYHGLDGFMSGIEKTISWFLDPNNAKYYHSSGYVV